MKKYAHFLKNVCAATTMAVVFAACQSSNNQNQQTATIQVLEIDNIYQNNLVKDFIFAVREGDLETQQSIAKADFLRAIDLRVNQKNPAEALQYFRKSITEFPEANTYYEMSDALIELQKYEEAANALQMAEELHFVPLANLYVKQAKVTAMNDKEGYSVVMYLQKAVEQGFADKAALENEPAFASLKDSEQLKRFYLENFTSGQDKESAEFRIFLAGFPVAEDGYTLEGKNIEDINKGYINYDFAKYVKEMETRQDFGREVGSDYFYAAKVQETAEYVAVVYIARDAVSEVMPTIFASLVTYNLKGTEIDKITFACQCDYKTLKTGKIIGNQITVTEQNREWESELTEVAPSENKIKSVTEVAKTSYLIAKNGKIEQQSQNMGLLSTQTMLASK
jgi:tetratricopeptide (TPR) repeat protein